MGTPSSQIYVCSGVRLTNAYRHTIHFASRQAQLAFFQGKVVHGFPNYTYLRKSWNIKVQATMENALTWDYLFFQNSSDGKWWFYFITNIEYINDNTVELSLEMDVMQTYMFDYELLPCFVEREHIADDTIGANVVDEGLEVGEYVSINDQDVDLNDYLIMILATGDPGIAQEGGELVPSLGSKFNNVFCGLGVYFAPIGQAGAVRTMLNSLSENGVADMIVAIWMYPGELVSRGSVSSTVGTVTGATSFEKDIIRNSTLDGGYTPRNSKLFCYPYNFLYVTNNMGGAAVYHYERFGNMNNPYFKIVGSVSPDACVRMYPLNYKGTQHNFESGLTLGSFPTCAWDSDVYKMWLAQNQNSLNVSGATAAIKAVAGIATAATAGGVTAALGGAAMAYSGVVSIAELMAQRADKSIQPEEAKGNYSATVNMTAGFQTFTIRKKCVTKAQAEKLDDFFDMFGYKTLEVKVPNTAVRENWTYTKTRDCTIRGAFCVEDRTKIETIFNNGITFWKNGNNIGNYALSNKCV